MINAKNLFHRLNNKTVPISDHNIQKLKCCEDYGLPWPGYEGIIMISFYCRGLLWDPWGRI